VGVYVLFAVGGGALTGTVIAALGVLAHVIGGGIEAVVLVAAFCVAGLAILLEARHRVSPLPERKRQVPRGWVNWRHRTATAAAFGFMIGAGSLTFLEHATAYVLAVLILTGPGVGVGAAIGAFYGAARALPLVLTWISDVRAARRLQWERLFDLRRATTAVLCIAAVATVLATRVAASV
jgi:hypothetical protein